MACMAAKITSIDLEIRERVFGMFDGAGTGSMQAKSNQILRTGHVSTPGCRVMYFVFSSVLWLLSDNVFVIHEFTS